MRVIYHIHHIKAGLHFYRAVLGFGIRKKILFTIHSNYKDRDFKYKISSVINALVARKVNSVSNSVFNDYSCFVKKMKGGNFVSIPNGVDFSRVNDALKDIKSTGKREKNRMVCVGRMIPLKNHRFLISVLNRLPNCRLILIGAEGKEQKIRKLAQKNNLEDRVEFTGLISRDEVFKKIAQCSLYVSASYVEGMPISVLEAMSAGLLPILSNIEAHKEIKKNCDNVIVLPLDETIWIKEIKRVLEMPEKELQYLSKCIQKEVRKSYSLDNMHKKYLKLYQAMYG